MVQTTGKSAQIVGPGRGGGNEGNATTIESGKTPRFHTINLRVTRESGIVSGGFEDRPKNWQRMRYGAS